REKDYVMFINDTVYGPFIKPGNDWLDAFVEEFKPDIGVVTSSIDCCEIPEITTKYKRHPFPVAQSMCFIVNEKGWNPIMRVFSNVKDVPMRKWDIVVECECKISHEMFSEGLNISTTLFGYSGVDYRVSCARNPTANEGDPCFPACYFG